MSAPAVISAQSAALRIEFGAAASALDPSAGLRLALPHLAGEPAETIFTGLRPAGEAAGFTLFRARGLLAGCATEPADFPRLAAQARALYRRLLSVARGRHLYRVWNYVPRINAATGGIENYHAFCAGRSLAFEETFGPAFHRRLSAASAVGADGARLSLVFVAGRAAPRHIENPGQMPAYRYPPEHGPRSPSFARATVAAAANRRLVFISGTAAIKGHLTVAPGSLPEQLACTLDNLRLIGRAAGVTETLGAGADFARHFKVYLRRAEDCAAAAAHLDGALFRPGDRVSYLRADVCRAALQVEIEATLIAPAG